VVANRTLIAAMAALIAWAPASSALAAKPSAVAEKKAAAEAEKAKKDAEANARKEAEAKEAAAQEAAAKAKKEAEAKEAAAKKEAEAKEAAAQEAAAKAKKEAEAKEAAAKEAAEKAEAEASAGLEAANGKDPIGAFDVEPAKEVAVCALSDIGPGAKACSGFFQGNLLNNSPADLDAQAAGLKIVGLEEWDGKLVEPQINLGEPVVNFFTPLSGATIVGIHWGGGKVGPSPGTPGGVTAFYLFDAGQELDAFKLAFGAASGARLYRTDVFSAPPPKFNPPGGFGGSSNGGAAIPEPSTWALLILGFGAAGAMIRARRRRAFA
jgi:hypothetical protein